MILKMGALKKLQYLQKHTCVETNLFKKRLQLRFFPMNIAIFLSIEQIEQI